MKKLLSFLLIIILCFSCVFMTSCEDAKIVFLEGQSKFNKSYIKDDIVYYECELTFENPEKTESVITLKATKQDDFDGGFLTDPEIEVVTDNDITPHFLIPASTTKTINVLFSGTIISNREDQKANETLPQIKVTTVENTDDIKTYIHEQKYNYTLYQNIDSQAHSYIVYNNDRDIIEQNNSSTNSVTFKYIDDILKLNTFGDISAENVYFDLDSSIKSKSYKKLEYEDGEKVAYISSSYPKDYIIVEELFTGKYLLNQKLDFKNGKRSFGKIEFKNNEAIITYVTSKNKPVEETFKLNK